MGRQLSFFASIDDWIEFFKFFKNHDLLLLVEHREINGDDPILFSYRENLKAEAMIEKRLEAFITKANWTCTSYRKGGPMDSSNSEVIQLQEGGDIGLFPFGVTGFRIFAHMDAVADNAFVKKSEDFRNTYDLLAAFIKKYGMIDAEKSSYILPDAYRIYREHPDEVKGAYTCFSPKKIKTWPK